MPYIPEISNYKPFYIQSEGDSAATDTASAFGMVAKSNPYPLLPSPKEPYRNEWKDEDGDEEYTKKMYYEAFEFEVSFYVKTLGSSAASTLRSQVLAFFDKVKDGEFKTYDSYTGMGFHKVRYAGYTEESFKSRSNYARAIFKVKFKVNDPVTRFGFSSGSITQI